MHQVRDRRWRNTFLALPSYSCSHLFHDDRLLIICIIIFMLCASIDRSAELGASAGASSSAASSGRPCCLAARRSSLAARSSSSTARIWAASKAAFFSAVNGHGGHGDAGGHLDGGQQRVHAAHLSRTEWECRSRAGWCAAAMAPARCAAMPAAAMSTPKPILPGAARRSCCASTGVRWADQTCTSVG